MIERPLMACDCSAAKFGVELDQNDMAMTHAL